MASDKEYEISMVSEYRNALDTHLAKIDHETARLEEERKGIAQQLDSFEDSRDILVQARESATRSLQRLANEPVETIQAPIQNEPGWLVKQHQDRARLEANALTELKERRLQGAPPAPEPGSWERKAPEVGSWERKALDVITEAIHADSTLSRHDSEQVALYVKHKLEVNHYRIQHVPMVPADSLQLTPIYRDGAWLSREQLLAESGETGGL